VILRALRSVGFEIVQHLFAAVDDAGGERAGEAVELLAGGGRLGVYRITILARKPGTPGPS